MVLRNARNQMKNKIHCLIHNSNCVLGKQLQLVKKSMHFFTNSSINLQLGITAFTTILLRA